MLSGNDLRLTSITAKSPYYALMLDLEYVEDNYGEILNEELRDTSSLSRNNYSRFIDYSLVKITLFPSLGKG